MAIEFDVVTGLISPIEYGAVFDGVTDDTDAFVAAIAAAAASTPKKGVLVAGTMLFTPTADQLVADVPIYVNGWLKPQTTITLNKNCSIIGLGGGSGVTHPSHLQGPMCGISKPPGSIPTIAAVALGGGMVLENIDLGNCYIGVKASGLDSDPEQLNANGLRMMNVAAVCTTAGGGPLLIDRFYWLWAEYCVFQGTNGTLHADYCISVLDTGPVGGGGYSGLLNFEHCVTEGPGMVLNPVSTRGIDIVFKDHYHESLINGGTFCYARNITGLEFDNLEIGDSVGTGHYSFDVDGVERFAIKNGKGGYTFASWSEAPYWEGPSKDYTATDYGTARPNKIVLAGGDVDFRRVSRGAHSGPAVMHGTGVVYTPASAGNVTVTSGQIAPDGTTTAYLLHASVSAQSLTLVSQSWNLAIGDFLVFGCAAKVVDPTLLIDAQMIKFNCAADMKGMTYYDGFDLTPAGMNSAVIPVEGHSRTWLNNGWGYYWGIIEVAATPSVAPVMTLVTKLTNDFYIWKPWTSIITAAKGLSRADVVHWLNEVGIAPASNKDSVIGLQGSQTFSFGKSTTSALPSAATVGSGVVMYDTDRGTLVISNGTTWKIVTTT